MFFHSVSSATHEKQLKDANNTITDLQRQKEQGLREVAELKVQLKMTEEAKDTFRRDLLESKRKIREGLYSSLYTSIL